MWWRQIAFTLFSCRDISKRNTNESSITETATTSQPLLYKWHGEPAPWRLITLEDWRLDCLFQHLPVGVMEWHGKKYQGGTSFLGIKKKHSTGICLFQSTHVVGPGKLKGLVVVEKKRKTRKWKVILYCTFQSIYQKSKMPATSFCLGTPHVTFITCKRLGDRITLLSSISFTLQDCCSWTYTHREDVR